MTDKEIQRLSDLNRVAGYLLALMESPYVPNSGKEVAEKAYSILAPYLSIDE